jgi:hypothetical protein
MVFFVLEGAARAYTDWESDAVFLPGDCFGKGMKSGPASAPVASVSAEGTTRIAAWSPKRLFKMSWNSLKLIRWLLTISRINCKSRTIMEQEPRLDDLIHAVKEHEAWRDKRAVSHTHSMQASAGVSMRESARVVETAKL